MANLPEEYVSLCLQRVSNKAFKNAIAFSAQIQNDSCMIIVKNVTEESYFILESQLQRLSDVIGYYHDSNTKVISMTGFIVYLMNVPFCWRLMAQKKGLISVQLIIQQQRSHAKICTLLQEKEKIVIKFRTQAEYSLQQKKGKIIHGELKEIYLRKILSTNLRFNIFECKVDTIK
jgi:hypothetical protein